ncbi:SDR family NAD(P)-dependent oxidoreductase [Marinirhabdus gelatinilytica]|uniref:NAD(P)-dependent dehydrogenase (Short-subunit alcohol dehydrogenase family) n=1 Tax=Marinirhabdus gelatinilytica TaxID=1703343 RepID=A0A370QGP0_9FLAO|nr:SDR family oxidoreductase [Marinirhabdus gelatinilytica]RDK87230.1 NAD(P)-dependent dehydrogenase (short-subunit alcohol dehydrogenase family) [Marinirhabdus gelatinilytica]
MKNILLIGGSYGIGLEIAKKMSKNHNVTIASRTNKDIPEGIEHISFDVSSDTLSEKELPESIDGLVYCPGSINLKPFKMLSPEAFQKDLDINFISMIKTVHGLLPQLKKSDQASLVFFSTVAVKVGMPFHTSVAAAKGAIEGFAKALAAEYAPNFRVNVIAPSLTDTPLAGTLLSSEEKKEKMGERHPLKRVGDTKDIANLATFLLSEDSSWMTGQVLGVDGGMSTLNIQ